MTVPRRLLGPAPTAIQAAPRPAPCADRSGWIGRLDETLRTTATGFGLEPVWPPSIVIGVFGSGVCAAGASMAGWVGALVAALALTAGLAVLGAAAQRRDAVRAQELLPDACLHMTRTLRAGRSIDEALSDVARQVHPLPAALRVVAQQLDAGRSLRSALDEWTRAAESSAERILSVALVIGTRRGGDLGDALDAIGEGLRDDLELAARRRVLLVQATMSAAVLVLLPIVFSVLASVARGGVVFEGRLGAVLIAAGLTLDALGCVWIRRLMRTLR